MADEKKESFQVAIDAEAMDAASNEIALSVALMQDLHGLDDAQVVAVFNFFAHSLRESFDKGTGKLNLGVSAVLRAALCGDVDPLMMAQQAGASQHPSMASDLFTLSGKGGCR